MAPLASLRRAGRVACMAGAALMAGCHGGGGDRPTPPVARAVASAATSAPASSLSSAALLGRSIFSDVSLSASGKMSCATCHSPAHAYGPPNGLAVQLGGPRLDRQGLRAVPSLRYVLGRTPHWAKQFQSDPIERVIETDSVPAGGFARDGRFDTLAEQAAAPLLAPDEMANASPAAVVQALRAAPYADEFRRVFGADVFDHADRAFAGALQALERFELEDPSFHPYSSRFDGYLKHQIRLTDQETRGLQLFADPKKGNCAACHTAAPGADGSPPLFTDFSFSTLGAPRNPKIAANADGRFFDLGLCGPVRRDLANERAYCGMFKTPSLRNVATRQVFLHNGVFTDLATVVRFYAERDLHPREWYPVRADGSVDRYDDLPTGLRDNIDVIDAPLDRKPGDAPVLSAREVQEIVAFLRTLSDAE